MADLSTLWVVISGIALNVSELMFEEFSTAFRFYIGTLCVSLGVAGVNPSVPVDLPFSGSLT